MKKTVLECCVDSVESALAAQAGGADRLELCANLIIGGTTPGVSLFREVKKKTNILVNALIRPRFGDFCYTESEFQIIKNDVELFQKEGADGVVIGVLCPDGNLDLPRMEELIEAAGSMTVTLHRAFDLCRDPLQALEEAKNLGVKTILSSGQKDNCTDGKVLLKQLVEQAAGEVDILVGSGVKASVIRELAAFTKATSFHMSGKISLDSPMLYRKSGLSMGLPVLSEYVIWQTSEQEVKQARIALDQYAKSLEEE